LGWAEAGRELGDRGSPGEHGDDGAVQQFEQSPVVCARGVEHRWSAGELGERGRVTRVVAAYGDAARGVCEPWPRTGLVRACARTPSACAGLPTALAERTDADRADQPIVGQRQ
jgi:hypothetical protein